MSDLPVMSLGKSKTLVTLLLNSNPYAFSFLGVSVPEWWGMAINFKPFANLNVGH